MLDNNVHFVNQDTELRGKRVYELVCSKCGSKWTIEHIEGEMLQAEERICPIYGNTTLEEKPNLLWFDNGED